MNPLSTNELRKMIAKNSTLDLHNTYASNRVSVVFTISICNNHKLLEIENANHIETLKSKTKR